MSAHNRSLQFGSSGLLLTAAVLGFLGVALGAFGAHGLKNLLESTGKQALWETAVSYQFWHVLAILALAMSAGGAEKILVRAGQFFTVGVLIFSGTLYIMALGGPTWLGAITPIGGTCLLIGWGILIYYAAKRLKSAG